LLRLCVIIFLIIAYIKAQKQKVNLSRIYFQIKIFFCFNKYPYKAQGRKMRVLIETITSRRGYKNFANETELDDFLAQNHNKITDYQILQEDEDAVIRSDLQAFAGDCKSLMIKIYQYWLNNLHQNKRYGKLTLATQSLLNAMAYIEECLK
jgi:hypothetical protein